MFSRPIVVTVTKEVVQPWVFKALTVDTWFAKTWTCNIIVKFKAILQIAETSVIVDKSQKS